MMKASEIDSKACRFTKFTMRTEILYLVFHETIQNTKYAFTLLTHTINTFSLPYHNTVYGTSYFTTLPVVVVLFL